jgi:hypothetical protein
MASSQTQGLTTAQQLARLRWDNVDSKRLVKALSERRDEMATVSEPGVDSATRGLRAKGLAWELALAAQSCAYLAIELQLLAEKLAGSRIACRESTFKSLLDSAETFRAWLDIMQQRCKLTSEQDDVGWLLELSEPLGAATPSISARVQADTSDECTTSTERVETSPTGDAGDTS